MRGTFSSEETCYKHNNDIPLFVFFLGERLSRMYLWISVNLLSWSWLNQSNKITQIFFREPFLDWNSWNTCHRWLFYFQELCIIQIQFFIFMNCFPASWQHHGNQPILYDTIHNNEITVTKASALKTVGYFLNYGRWMWHLG